MNPTPDPDQLLTSEEVAALLRVTVNRLAKWRCHKPTPIGPDYQKLSPGKSGRVRYRRGDVLDWLDRQRRTPVAS